MKATQFRLAALAVLLLGGCSTSVDDFVSTYIAQRTVLAGTSATIALTAGDEVSIPAGTFDDDTVVVFSNVFTGGDGNTANFPTPGKTLSDLLSAVVINTPVDKRFNNDIALTFDIIDPGDGRFASAVVPNETYRVYRFDFDNVRWQPWGDTVAEVNADGTRATATLPTEGFLGFIGSLALFDGLLDDGTREQTAIRGTVRDLNGDPIATDVGLYIAVGTNLVPVDVENGRVPVLTDTNGIAFTSANTVDSAADGTFEMLLDGSLVGQIVGIEFGHEDADFRTQDVYDVLAPAVPEVAIEHMTVRYGENNIVSQPVRSGDG